MSTSGLRFSKEVDFLKKKIKKLGKIKSINALVVNDFFKYGVHMLDVIDELNLLKVNKVLKLKSNIDQIIFYCENKVVINLQCLGNVNKIFFLGLVGKKASTQIEINDNFSAFKNTLNNFIKMIRTKKQVINYKKSIKVINFLSLIAMLIDPFLIIGLSLFFLKIGSGSIIIFLLDITYYIKIILLEVVLKSKLYF